MFPLAIKECPRLSEISFHPVLLKTAGQWPLKANAFNLSFGVHQTVNWFTEAGSGP